MKITLYLDAEVTAALRQFALEANEDLDAAAKMAIREFLVGMGMMGPPGDLDEDTETVGEA